MRSTCTTGTTGSSSSTIIPCSGIRLSFCSSSCPVLQSGCYNHSGRPRGAYNVNDCGTSGTSESRGDEPDEPDQSALTMSHRFVAFQHAQRYSRFTRFSRRDLWKTIITSVESVDVPCWEIVPLENSSERCSCTKQSGIPGLFTPRKVL